MQKIFRFKPSSFGSVVVFILGIMCASPGSWAQEQGSTLADIKKKTAPDQADIEKIDEYIRAQLDRLSEPPDERLVRRFKDSILQQENDRENTTVFRKLYAARCAELFTKRLGQDSPIVDYALTDTLAALTESEALSGLEAALRLSKFAGVRTLAAQAIRDRSKQIESSPDLLSELIRKLGDAASNETHPIVLTRIYQCFEFGLKEEEQAKAIATSLKSQLERYKQGSTAPNEGNLYALQQLLRLASRLSQADQVELVRVLAEFMTLHAERYLHAQLGREYDEILLGSLVMIEKVLVFLTRPQADVAQVGVVLAMEDDEVEDRDSLLKQSIVKWVGSPEQPGYLAGAPWQLPPGAGLAGLELFSSAGAS